MRARRAGFATDLEALQALTLPEAAEGLIALFGASGRKARTGALLLAAVLTAHLPKLPNVILDETDDG